MLVSIKGLKINWKYFGSGNPILLLHGWGGSIQSLLNLGKLLSERDLKVYLLDLPGFGKSGKPVKSFNLDDYAEVVEDFLKQLGINELFVFGHSFGGAVAIKLAVRGNIKVRKLVLCNASGIRKLKTISHPLSVIVKLGKVIKRIPILKEIYLFFRKVFYYHILGNRDYIDYEEIAGTYKKIVAEDLTPLLHKVKVPTLLIWGEKDKDTPLAYADIFHKGIKSSELKVYKNEGHGLPKSKPELIYKDIKRFLRK